MKKTTILIVNEIFKSEDEIARNEALKNRLVKLIKNFVKPQN